MISILPKFVKSEEAMSRHINIVSHYDDVTLLDKSDKLIQILHLKGLDPISHDQASLDAYKNRLSNLLKGFSSEFALYTWEVRRRVSDYPSSCFKSGYANELNKRYKSQIESASLFQSDLYLAVMTKQPEGFINLGFSLLQQLNQVVDEDQRTNLLAKRHANLFAATQKIMNAMGDYGCKQLSIYERNGIKFSEPLEFIAQVINIDPHSIQLESKAATALIPSKRIFFNNRAGTIEVRNINGKSRFASMLAIKGYSPRTAQGMLDEISKLKCEYLITQSYRFYDRQNAKNKVRDQQKEMQQTRDESVSQTQQLDDAFDDAASGEIGLGLHHFTMAVYADTLEELNRHISLVSSCLADIDITCVREDIGCECAFWSQLPGNFGYALRSVPISTRNFAGLASFHNYHRGKLTGNHWGGAITVFETLAGTPYYFNFHHKDVGNFLVFGSMGSGKTLLTGFLIAQSMKFGGKRIIFDKDRGLEIFVRALGGTYERIKPGIATGFNPCQLEDTTENRAFLVSLLSRLLSINEEILTEADGETITSAIDGMYRLDKESRQFCHLASFLGARKSGSLRNRFDQWHSDGQYAWLFDNEEDSLSLHADVIGFDLSHILNDKVCKTPALMYLIYRMQQVMAGQKGIIFFDEGWLALSDPVFGNLFNDLGRTPRKKNIVFGLATQAANDIADSPVNKAINESAHCKIFFPNPAADYDVYVGKLGLSEHQYHLVKALPDDQHYFLLVHGHGVNQESIIARPNLSAMQEDIAIISGRESSIALLDQIRAEVGDNPVDWLPIFKAKMRNFR